MEDYFGTWSSTSTSCFRLSFEIALNEIRSRCARDNPNGTTDTNVTSHRVIPQLAAISLGTPNKCSNAAIVANCDPPPTPGNCISDPTMLDPINSRTWVCGISSATCPYAWVT